MKDWYEFQNTDDESSKEMEIKKFYKFFEKSYTSIHKKDYTNLIKYKFTRLCFHIYAS